MTDIKERVKNQRVRISMNQKHLCIQSGDPQLIQMENGQYRELAVRSITFHREGDNGESPWTRWYDLSDKNDAEDIAKLRAMMDKNPFMADDIRLRVRIVGEFDSSEPWPGYDDQDSEQIIAYYNASPPSVRPELEKVLQYELSKTDEKGESTTDPAKVVAIETLDKSHEKQAKMSAGAGVKM